MGCVLPAVYVSGIGTCPASAVPSNDRISVVQSCLHLPSVPDAWALVGSPCNKPVLNIKFTTMVAVCMPVHMRVLSYEKANLL